MFSIQHFIWLGICVVLIYFSLKLIRKNNIRLDKLLDYCFIVCILSELTKIFSVIEIASSTDGTIMRPYIPANHFPLHLCSIQILLILVVKNMKESETKRTLLSFMYPTTLLGAIAALAMPSIFTTTISVSDAFVAPMAYQFFIYHSMLIVLGISIARSDEMVWRKKDPIKTIEMFYFIGFVSLYLNSIFASPTYVNGELISVDFWPNFFFTYDDPIGLNITTKAQWMIYLVVICLLAAVCIWLSYRPLKKKMVD